MSTELNFSLQRDRLHEQVADQIEKLIVNESLRPGDKLPSERELAQRLHVSRTVIREAIRTLSVRGLIQVKQGSGSYVQQLSPSNASAPIGLFLKLHQAADVFSDLCEVRRTLEIDVAGLAAERATGEDIAALEGSIEEMATHIEEADQFVQRDLDFHAALAMATHNDLYEVLLVPITDLLLEFRLTAYKYDEDASIEGALVHHRRILDRVKARDNEGARQAMQEHLQQAETLFEAAREEAGLE